MKIDPEKNTKDLKISTLKNESIIKLHYFLSNDKRAIFTAESKTPFINGA